MIWVIVEMSQNPFDKEHQSTDSDALYSWTLRPMDRQWTTSSGFSYSDVMQLMKHFEVMTAPELVGKIFISDRKDASSALNLLLVQIKHGGEYTPPELKSLRDLAAQALSRIAVPDFTDVDNQTVHEAFQEVWEGFFADRNWLNSFKAQISQLSEGKVALLDCNPNEFSMMIKGPANYLVLVSGNRRQKVIMGPYATPIEFC